MPFVGGLVVPGHPQVLLAPEQNAGWGALNAALTHARGFLDRVGAEVLVFYSTRWPSVIGHQVQADPEPVWTHVDQEFHELGSIDYRFRVDADYAAAYVRAAQRRGLHARTVSYHGFPIDTGSIVACKLLNPDNARPVTMTSCNMYADRGETLVLGKAAADALGDRRAVAVAVTALSNRMHTTEVAPADDRISSLKDDEWNRKILEFFGDGRLEDVSQLARQFTREANADSRFKAIWWLAAALGQHNRYAGEVLAYAPLYGTGGAVITLEPNASAALDQEFDEDDVEVYGGDRSVLAAEGAEAVGQEPAASPAPGVAKADDARVDATADTAPKPVGAYPHARRAGPFLYLSGVGPRQPVTDAIPGGPVWDEDGVTLDYDTEAQTRAVLENVKRILEQSGASLEQVCDVTCFLIDMERDFATFNRVYAEVLGPVGPTRTTVEVRSLPTPIAVELKVVALIS